MSESINIPHRQRSSSESTTSSLNHKPSSVKAALPSTSPFSSQPFKETSVSPTQPQTLSIQPPRRPSGSFELSGQPSPPGASGNSGITSLFRRFSFKVGIILVCSASSYPAFRVQTSHLPHNQTKLRVV